MLKILQFYQ